MKKTQKGFTLVELLVVIAILAILSTVAVVGYTSFINKAEKQAAETEAAQIADYIEATLISEDYVQLGSNVYLLEGNVLSSTTTGAEITLTSEFALFGEMAELKGKLSFDETNKKLVYTSEKGHKVDVLTGVTLYVAPTTP